jgi:D-alanine-D-alanine ligase
MKNVAVITGGNSGEYEISLKTAHNICEIIDKQRYTPYLIHLKGRDWTYTEAEKCYAIDKNDFSLTLPIGKISFDVVFIAIHGNPGEDGKIQGYFDMMQIPYTGCNCLCSALTFNKFFCNLVVSQLGVPISPSLHFFKNDDRDMNLTAIEMICGYPCFVKPCNSGSSVGVTKVHQEEELKAAIDEAFRVDDQLMIEKFIQGREVTCGVAVVDGEVTALAVTEVVAKKEFYDYEAKYSDAGHELITPAVIDPKIEALVKRYSELIFRKLGCRGVVRIDFIVTPDGKPIFLEINTIPGQTSLSIVPGQVKYRGISLQDFYSALIEEAYFVEPSSM